MALRNAFGAVALDATIAAVRDLLASTLKVLPLIKPWAPWAAATAIDMRNYAGVEIQIIAVTGTLTFARSADDATYVALSATANGASATASAPSFYSLKGGGYLKWAGTGTVLVRGYN